MESIELNVVKRDKGSDPRQLRREGGVPGVIYGSGGPNVTLQADAHELASSGLRAHGSSLIRLRSTDPDLDNDMALMREVQGHPVSGALLHFDLLRLDMNKPVNANVPLAFTGKSEGVVEGGILQPIRRELEIRCLPRDLPGQIEVDVTELGVHDSIHVSEVVLPEGVEAIAADELTIVTVLPPVVEAEPEVEEEELEEVTEEGAAPAEGAPTEGAPAEETPAEGKAPKGQ